MYCVLVEVFEFSFHYSWVASRYMLPDISTNLETVKRLIEEDAVVNNLEECEWDTCDGCETYEGYQEDQFVYKRRYTILKLNVNP